jgi:hypothetical protein
LGKLQAFAHQIFNCSVIGDLPIYLAGEQYLTFGCSGVYTNEFGIELDLVETGSTELWLAYVDLVEVVPYFF